MCPENSSLFSRKDSPNPDRADTSLRILLVDDESSILAYLAELLTSWGHHVLPFCGCSVAEVDGILRDATEFEFDVAIVDTVMPGTNGMQLLELINQVSPATVLVSADTGPCINTALELMKKGICVHPLVYPFEVRELQGILDSARHSLR